MHLQLAELMAVPSLTSVDKAAKSTLFVRLVEFLPHAASRQHEVEGSLAVVTDVLAAIRGLVAGRHEGHQALFRYGGLVQPQGCISRHRGILTLAVVLQRLVTTLPWRVYCQLLFLMYGVGCS